MDVPDPRRFAVSADVLRRSLDELSSKLLETGLLEEADVGLLAYPRSFDRIVGLRLLIARHLGLERGVR